MRLFCLWKIHQTPQYLCLYICIQQFLGNPEHWVCLPCSQKLQYTHYVNINMKDSIVSSWLHVSSFLFRDYFLELLLLCFVILDVHCKSQLFKELPKFGLDQSFEDQRNWGFNRITLSLQPNVVDRLYLKLWIQFDQII